MGLFEQFPYTNFHELNLDWFLNTFKELLTEWEEQKREFSDLKEAWQELRNYVANYFDNLDVQNEINNKLDQMAADGSLGAILDTLLTDFEIDYNTRLAALSARVDQFEQLTPGSTTGDAELQDIRIAYNGLTYPTAGDAVRAQASKAFDEALFNVTTFANRRSGLDWYGGSIDPNTGENFTDNRRIRSGFADITKGRRLFIIPGSDIKYRVARYGADDTFVEMGPWMESVSIVYGSETAARYRVLCGYKDDRIVNNVSQTAALSTINIFDTMGIPYMGQISSGAIRDYNTPGFYTALGGSVPNITDLPANFPNSAFYLFSVRPGNPTSVSMTWQYISSIDGMLWSRVIYLSAGAWSVWTGWKQLTSNDRGNPPTNSLMDCVIGGYYHAGAAAAAEITDLPDGYPGNAFNLTVITPAYAGSVFVEQNLLSVTGTRWRRVLQKDDDGVYQIYYDWKLDGGSAADTPFIGKKLSVMGDSISAFAGDIPAGYEAFYTGSNAGIINTGEMWYSVVCANTGLSKLVINAWSGSGVTQLQDSSHSSKPPMSSDERCSALGTDSEDPDVIIIAGGVNDYTYAMSAQSEPLDWDPLTTPTTGDSFTEAYASMIRKMRTNYPRAMIVALSTFFTQRGTAAGVTYYHTSNGHRYTQNDYNAKIKMVCDAMDVPYIDVSDVGFSPNNYYPNYAQDDATHPTHPNANGHHVIGMKIAAALKVLAAGFLR